MALVELVEEDRPDPGELAVAEHAAHEQPLGQEADPRARTADVLEADLVADRLPDVLAPLVRDPAGGQARGQAARLEDQDLTRDHVEERGRDPGGLAAAGCGLDDERLPRPLESGGRNQPGVGS